MSDLPKLNKVQLFLMWVGWVVVILSLPLLFSVWEDYQDRQGALKAQAAADSALPTQVDAETQKRLEGKACHPAPESHSGCLVVDKSGAVLLLNAHHMIFDGGRVELRLRAIPSGHKAPTDVYAGGEITFEELQKKFKKVVFRDDPDYAWYAEGYFAREGR